jgi:hypothetical protein
MIWADNFYHSIQTLNMIYDYLFYKSYQLGQRSRNFDDMPVLAGVIWVSLCFILNLFTLKFILEAGGIINISIGVKYKYIFSLILILLLVFYYTYKGNYLCIIKKHEAMERRRGRSLHPIIVIASYYIISFLLGMVAALYRNGDWIFNNNST